MIGQLILCWKAIHLEESNTEVIIEHRGGQITLCGVPGCLLLGPVYLRSVANLTLMGLVRSESFSINFGSIRMLLLFFVSDQFVIKFWIRSKIVQSSSNFFFLDWSNLTRPGANLQPCSYLLSSSCPKMGPDWSEIGHICDFLRSVISTFWLTENWS